MQKAFQHICAGDKGISYCRCDVFLTRIKYDMRVMKFISLFENLTGAKLKDCFINDDVVYFVVQEGQIGLALGKKGSNIRRVESVLNRKIKIVEFNSQLNQFIKNAVFPLRIDNISGLETDNGVITLTTNDSKTRGLLIGKAAQNLRKYEVVIKRYFDIKELRVT